MERVIEREMTRSSEFLRLSGSSQLLTSSEYITFLAEVDQKKKGMQELREKKKDCAKERKEEGLFM